MIQGRIEAVNSSTGETNGNPWTRWEFTIGGKKYSTFNADLAKHQVGDFVKIEGEMKGKYFNMKSMEKIDNPNSGAENVPVQKMSAPKADVQDQIARMSCLKSAVEFIGDESKPVEEVIGIAKEFFTYVKNGN